MPPTVTTGNDGAVADQVGACGLPDAVEVAVAYFAVPSHALPEPGAIRTYPNLRPVPVANPDVAVKVISVPVEDAVAYVDQI